MLQQGTGEAHSTHVERQDQPNRFPEFSFCSKRSVIPIRCQSKQRENHGMAVWFNFVRWKTTEAILLISHNPGNAIKLILLCELDFFYLNQRV